MSASTWALVPLKSSEHAKSRLAEVLDDEQRKRLFFALAEQVILALHESRNVDGIAIVTSSREVAAFAKSLDAMPILQDADVGMSPALQYALRSLQSMQPKQVLMVPGDLPLISTRSVDAIFAGQRSGEQIVLVPDRHYQGTNALLCSPPQAITPCFGSASFARHLSAARATNIATRVIEIEELALDLDCADDLECLRSHAGHPSQYLLTPTRTLEPSDAPLRAVLAG